MSELISRLRYGLIPAVPVPFDGEGKMHASSHSAYVSYLSQQPISGVAVWAHTGRGLHLTVGQRKEVLRTWREALPGKVVVAGVGGDPNAETDDEFHASAAAMAEDAAKGGADAFLVYAPARYRDLAPDEQERKILDYHRRIASHGVPLLVFYLYEDAGGISYSPQLLRELAGLSEVVGMKIATAFNIVAYQDIVATFNSVAPEKLFITGEDRFLGYSLMCGAEAALIGMGSACTGLQKAMMDAYFSEVKQVPRQSHPATEPYAGKSFLELSAAVDRFCLATFAEPIQGYIQRMLWGLVELGVIDEAGSHDPWGMVLSADDRARVVAAVREAVGGR